MNFLLDGQEVHQRLVNPRMRVVAPRIQQTAERILHRAGRRRIDMALRRRQMDDVFTEEVVGNVDAFGEDAIEHAHSRLRLVVHPCHVLVLEVVTDGNVVAFEDRHVVVQILALERVRHDRLVLHADLIGEAAPRQRLNRPFELPRRRVRGRKGKVPRDVVLQNRGLTAGEGGGQAAELYKAIDVGQNRIGGDPKNRHLGFHEP